MNKYQVHKRGGVTCRLVDSLPPEFTAWIAKPCDPWAWGKFLAAFTSLEDAQAVAGALNAAEELLAKLERLAPK